MGLEPQDFTEKTLAPKLFVEKSCFQGKKTIPHQKLLPECKNVTKQNCVTLWETDNNGEQVNFNYDLDNLLLFFKKIKQILIFRSGPVPTTVSR